MHWWLRDSILSLLTLGVRLMPWRGRPASIQTSQRFAAAGSDDADFDVDDCGSYDMYFGLKAPVGTRPAGVETLLGKSWLVALRMYLVAPRMYDLKERRIENTWRPGEFERLPKEAASPPIGRSVRCCACADSG